MGSCKRISMLISGFSGWKWKLELGFAKFEFNDQQLKFKVNEYLY